MRLAYTNAAFTHRDVPMPDVPVLLSDDMAIIEGPQQWLFYVALERGRTRSPATWRSYGEALHDWLQTCQANGWAWDEIEEGHLRAYRNQMLYHPSSVTGQPYSRRTINGRLRRLAMFYGWAFRHGLIVQLPFEYESVRTSVSPDADLLAHLRTGEVPAALDLTVREYRTVPSALSVEDLRRVRAHLTARDALIADWAVSVAPIAAAERQFGQQPWRANVQCGVPAAHSRVGECASQKGFPRTRRSGDQKIVLGRHPAGLSQVHDDRSIESSGRGEVDVLHGRLLAELRRSETER